MTARYSNDFGVGYDETLKTVTMEIARAHIEVEMSNMLARVLGFSKKTSNGPISYVGERIPVQDGPNMMFVYCDVIEYVIVGDSRVLLLRTFAMDKKKNSSEVIHQMFQHPIYVPVQKKHFDSIEINIMTDTGEPMPFAFGKSVALLHFRRSSNPYFLLER